MGKEILFIVLLLHLCKAKKTMLNKLNYTIMKDIKMNITDEQGNTNEITLISFEEKIEATITSVVDFGNNNFGLKIDTQIPYLDKNGNASITNTISKSLKSLQNIPGDCGYMLCLNNNPVEEFVTLVLKDAKVTIEREYHEKDEVNSFGEKYTLNCITNHISKCEKEFSKLNMLCVDKLAERKKVQNANIWAD